MYFGAPGGLNRAFPGGGGALTRVVIRFITDILAKAIGWKRHAQHNELHKGLDGASGLDQRGIPVYAATGKERLRHLAYAVRLI